MAEREVKTIITIDAQRGTRSLRDFRQQVSECKGALDKAVAGTEEYERALVDLKTAQGAYNKELRVCVKENQQAEGSYNKLTAQLARLKEQWKATGDAAERARLTQQVNAIKGQLNEMDHSIGNWHDNVGNYAGSLKSLFGGLGGSIGSFASKLGIAGAAIGAGVAAVKGWISAAKETQTTGDSLNELVQQWTTSWDLFQKSIATFNFDNFNERVQQAQEKASQLFRTLDDATERANSVALQRADLAEKLAAWEETARDTSLSNEKRLEAAKKIQENLLPLYEQEKETKQRIANDQLEYIVAMGATKKLSEEELEVEKERLRTFMTTYNENEELINQAKEYLSAERALEDNRNNMYRAQTRAMYRYYEGRVRYQQSVIDGADEEVKSIAKVVAAYNMLSNAEIQAYVDAQTAAGNANKAFYDENKRIVTLIDSLTGKGAGSGSSTSPTAGKSARQQSFENTRKEELRLADAEAKDREVRARAEIDDERELAVTLYNIRVEINEKKLSLLIKAAADARKSGYKEIAARYEKEAADLQVKIEQDAITEKARLRRQDAADAEKVADDVLKQVEDEGKRQSAALKNRAAARLKALDAEQKLNEAKAKVEVMDAEALEIRLNKIREEAYQKRISALRKFAEEARLAGDEQAVIAYEQQIADARVQNEIATQDAIARERKAARLRDEKEQKEHYQRTQQMTTSMATLFGNVASAYQAYLTQRVEGGKMSEKAAEDEFQVIKNIQQAQTWISTLSGMMSVWAGEGTTAFKIAQSAAVFSQGLAATMQIANTTLGSVAKAAQSVTSAAVAAPVVLTAMPQVQTVTSASQEDVLNQRAAAQRVYVVYSDIAQAGKRVRVTDSESRF